MTKPQPGPAAGTEAIVSRFLDLSTRASSNTDLIRRGRFLTGEFALFVDDVPLLVSIVEGRVMRVVRGPFLLKPWMFAIRASAADWSRFLEPMPVAGWHDLMAMTKRGIASVEGDLKPFMANLQFIKDVLATPRDAAAA